MRSVVRFILMAHRRLSIFASIPLFFVFGVSTAQAALLMPRYPAFLLAVAWGVCVAPLALLCVLLYFDDLLTVTGAYRLTGRPGRLILKRLSARVM